MGADLFALKGDHPMSTDKESKIAAIQRLHREGSWEEAFLYRNPHGCHRFDAFGRS